jgi:hypothetical protein
MLINQTDFFARILRNADGGGSGAPTFAPASSTPGAAPSAPSGVAATPTVEAPKTLVDLAKQTSEPAKTTPSGTPALPGSAYTPDGMPKELVGTTDRETIDKMLKANTERGSAPEKPELYAVTLTGAAKDKLGDLKGDPGVAVFQRAAHKAGLTQPQFNAVISDVYTGMVDGGLMPAPIDPMAEMEKLMPRVGDEVQRRSAAASRINGVVNAIDALTSRGEFSKAESNELVQIAVSATGVMALEKMLRLSGETGLQGARGQGGTAITSADAKAMLKDARYSTSSPTYDPAFRKQADDAMRASGGTRQ